MVDKGETDAEILPAASAVPRFQWLFFAFFSPISRKSLQPKASDNDWPRLGIMTILERWLVVATVDEIQMGAYDDMHTIISLRDINDMVVYVQRFGGQLVK